MNMYLKFAYFSPVLVLLAAISQPSFGHGGGHPTRYVAPSGEDSGECGSPASPCASIQFAVQQSNKGDKIKVAAGSYEVDELEVFYLLSAMVEITGAYSTKDAYKKQDINANVTKIVGIPANYREKLYERGFTLVQDVKAQELGLGKTEKAWLGQYSKRTTERSSSEACVNGRSDDNPCRNIDRIAHIPLSQFSSNPSSANDIWGFVDLNNQREYALIGVNNGTTVFDLSDPSSPAEVGHITGANSTWRDVKVYQYFDDAAASYKAYAYVTTEGFEGLQVIDLNNLPESVSLAADLNPGFQTAHNVYLANVNYATGEPLEGFNPYLYISGANASGGVFLTFDLSNPLSPARVANGDSGYVHDATSLVIDDSRTSDCRNGHNPCELFIDFNEDTVDIWDMTDKANPLLISETSYPNVGYVHSGWWSDDKMTIFIQDELDERNSGMNTTLRALDISDLNNPRVVGTYTGPTRAIDHNGFTKGDYYYMSNYRRGLVVIDVSDPRDMEEVAFFDTFAVPVENTPSFNGAWGAYPYLPSENILVSDIEYGLWVLRLNNNNDPAPTPTPIPTPIPATEATPEPSPELTPMPDSTAEANGNSGSGGGAISWVLLVLCALLQGSRYSLRSSQRVGL